ncbi:acyl-[acyl-carrier-protein]-phospholipid O-acyltransferase/long-chain-fatty-acid--[acyl-carrier-protein] ligase [Phenylobacterium haematophilum]|uniref:Acyl-[acyl-carrier-protein]-phospholipid O-acyltransferase/long-chain-fatty-acid--[acyl-carrier-protein] ligase n=1 Tax=Phenylobacterium haematophilum TaxID=98513 RepID=A0A839ZVT6_9CAUL|nr:AMP-binding protein [Phenylobacterium haematophilum]MBB3890174.1 acyl-[acyl-carrier-protein]-phospholipid O-acyltransferase/long-chain-fatty-acid--[acyl-carrier-protein] ligase [Phenylobacterium haematophilum]
MSRSFDPRSCERSLFDALVDARATYGAKKPILEDQERKPLTYTDLIRAAFALGRKIAAMTTEGERVGVMLPASAGAVVTFFALHAFGRTPAMLNFTAGIRNLKAACELAGVKRVLTSHRFIEQGKLHDLIDALEPLAAITYLEDVRETVGLSDKLFAAAAGAFPKRFRAATKPSDPGVILFTSGSFGAPRGVILSQANLIANVEQVAAHIPLDPSWVMFNPLPTFHCFGLTGGVLLPLMKGMKAFEYPSPLHVKQIPPLIKDTGASILFATDTFLNQYARAAERDELSGLQFIVCGAEKVRDETHNLIRDRFGDTPVLEGYGATEASPVIAVNKPTDNRRGTVGGLLPGIEAKLEKVEGIPGGGRLFVRGPNIMAGYLTENGLEPPPGGWHDTGDVVDITSDNWIKILGRVKRFAKVGGEMVSLTAAEDIATAVWPDSRHAVIAMPDSKKGERLVLVTDRRDADTGPLVAHAQSIGAPELAVPRKIIRVTEIPVLGTGKTDYVAITRMAEADGRRAA